MTNRLAVIDLGTNTFNLLIADVNEDKITRIFSEEIPVKLGEGGINIGFITPEAWSRGLDAIKYIHNKIAGYTCRKVKAVATSAIRNASNGNNFKQAVKAETGIDIEIINGDREADLIYEGVRSGINMKSLSLIMDIGGGSVEFIICDKTQIYWKKSYPVGAARIKERFYHSDPITPANIQLIEQHLNDTLTDLFYQCTIYKPQWLIGSAGAFETFAELVSIRYGHIFSKDNSEFVFKTDQFFEIATELLNSDHSQRENMPGLIPFRTDMIVPATVLTMYILQRTGINSLKLSSYSLKEGVLVNLLKIRLN